MACALESRKAQSTLCIGDTVMLYSIVDDDPNKDYSGGYVFSEVSCSVNESLALFPAESATKCFLPNIHYATFEVVPAACISFKERNKWNALKSKLSNEGRTEEESDAKELKKAKESMEHEKEENRKISKQKGKSVVYGEKIKLKHTLSGKFISVSGAQVSNTELTSLEVLLSDETDTGCVFKIFTYSHRHQSLGEEVAFGEEIRLEHAFMNRFNLHCSAEHFGDKSPVYKSCHEINLASGRERSTFQIILHQSVSEKTTSNLKAGEPVLLFGYQHCVHVRGVECPTLEEERQVHYKKVHFTTARMRSECTSADRLWMLEKKDSPCDGGPITPGEECYIKLVSNHSYLSCTFDPKTSTTTKGVQQSALMIAVQSIVLNHCSGKQYLNKAELLMPGSSLEEVLLSETTPLVEEISVSGTQADADDGEVKSKLSSVTDETVNVSVKASEERERKMSTACFKVLHGSADTKLKNIQLESTFVRVQHVKSGLFLGFGTQSSQHGIAQLILSEQGNYFILDGINEGYVKCLWLIKGVQPICSAYLPLLSHYPGKRRGALEVILRALKQLNKYLSQRWKIPNSIVKAKQKYMRNMQFLKSIISLIEEKRTGLDDESLLVDVQKECYGIIVAYLTGGSRKNSACLLKEVEKSGFFSRLWEEIYSRTPLSGKAVEVFCLLTENTTELVKSFTKLMPIDVVMEVGLSSTTRSDKEDSFDGCIKALINKCIDLFSSADVEFKPLYIQLLSVICTYSGYPIRSVQNTILDEFILNERILKFLFSTQKRTTGVQFFRDEKEISLAMMAGERCVAERGLLYGQVKLFESVCKGSNYAAIKHLGPIMEYEHLLWCLKEFPRDGSNELLACIVDLVRVLHVDKQDVSKASTYYPLPSVYIIGGMVSQNTQGLGFAYVKIWLDNYFKDKFVYDKRKNRLSLAALNLLYTLIEHGYCMDSKVAKKVVDEMCSLLEGILHANHKLAFKILLRCLDVLLLLWKVHMHQYAEDSALQKLMAFTCQELTEKMASKDSALQKLMASTCQELTKKDIEKSIHEFRQQNHWPFDEAKDLVKVLLEWAQYRYETKSLQLMQHIELTDVLLFRRSHLIFSKGKGMEVQLYSDVVNKVPNFKRILKSLKLPDHIVSVFERDIKDFCMVGEQSLEHSHIFNVTGLVDEIIDFVLEGVSDVGLCLNDSIFEAAFLFLAAVARNNHNVKQRLFSMLNKFLLTSVAVPAMAVMVREIFINEPELCLKLHEEHVEKIFEQVHKLKTIYGDEVEGLMGKKSGMKELLAILETTAQCPTYMREYDVAFHIARPTLYDRYMKDIEDCVKGHYVWIHEEGERVIEHNLPLKRNQHFIITHFLESLKHSFSDLFSTEKKIDRLMLLRWREATDKKEAVTNRLDLEVLLSITSLLASCAEGKQDHIESVCQKVLPLDEILDILIDPDISWDRKLPFLRFLTSVYVDTDASLSPDDDDFVTIMEGERVWTLLHLFCPYLDSLLKREGVTGLLRQFIGEGVLPILTVFYARFFPELKENDEFPERLTFSCDLCVHLQELLGKDTSDIFTETQKCACSTVVRTMVTQARIHRKLRKDKPNKLVLMLNFEDDESPSFDGIPPPIKFDDTKLSEFEELEGHFSLCKTDDERARFERILIEQLRFSVSTQFQKGFKTVSHPESEYWEQVQLDIQCLQIIRVVLRKCNEQSKEDKRPGQDIVIDGRLVNSVILYLVHPESKLSLEAMLTFQAILEFVDEDNVEKLFLPILQNDQLMECFTTVTDDRMAEAAANYNAIYGVIKEIDHHHCEKQKLISRLRRNPDSLEQNDKDEEDFDAVGDPNQPKPAPRRLTWINRSLHLSCSEHITLPLNVISLCCRTQYYSIQDYLRQIPDHISPINVVGAIGVFLEVMHDSEKFHFQSLEQTLVFLGPDDIVKKDWRMKYTNLIKCTFEALTKLCVDNYTNKMVLFQRNVVTLINLALLPAQESDNAFDMKKAAIELLYVLLEDTHPDTKTLAKRISETLNYTYLDKCFEEFSGQGSKQDMETMARAYHVILMLRDYGLITLMPDAKNSPSPPLATKNGVSRQEVELPSLDDPDVSSFVRTHTRSVEILYNKPGSSDRQQYDATTPRNQLIRVHFSYPPAELIEQDIKDKVSWELDRSSAEDKLRDLLDWTKKDMKKLIEWQAHVDDEGFRRRLRKWFFPPLLIFLYTLMINIILLAGYSVNGAGASLQIMKSNTTGQIVLGNVMIYVLGPGHFILLCIAVLQFYLNSWPYLLKAGWYRKVILSLWKAFQSRLRGFWYRHPTRSEGDFSKRRFEKFGIWGICLICFATFSLLGLLFTIFLHATDLRYPVNLIFYALCLLQIVNVVDYPFLLLKRSILTRKTGKNIILVSLLGVIILFIYAVSVFVFLAEDFPNDDFLYCRTLGECVVSLLRSAVVNSNINDIPAFGFNDVGLRLIIDVTFFFLWTLIGLNIIIGFIVDSFAALREKKENMEKDQKNTCTICGLQRYEFDIQNPNKGFDVHVKKEHSMWNYIYFAHYLDCRKQSGHELTAVEKYVDDKISSDSIEFFPRKSSLSLDKLLSL